MVPKLTLDGGLLHNSTGLPAIDTLRAWEAEGRIEIFEADRAKGEPTPAKVAHGWPGARATNARSKVARKSEPGKTSFQGISSILFPQRDTNRLNMAEINFVAHLLRHHTQGRAIFVTTNQEIFLLNGKRERLAALKIIVLTPEETILALESSSAAAGGLSANG